MKTYYGSWEDEIEDLEDVIDRIEALIDDGDKSEDLISELEYLRERLTEVEEDQARAQAEAWADELKEREHEFWASRF